MDNRFKTAFTLIELLVVIAIIGILSGLIIVGMSSSVNSARVAKAQIFSSSLKNSLLTNLVSEWKLDGNAVDSWNSNNCTWYGAGGGTTTVNWRPASECIYGQCLNFDGTDDYLGCGNATNMNSASYTLSAWFKTTVVAADDTVGKRVITIHRSNGGTRIALMLRRNTPELFWIDPSAVGVELSSNAVGNDGNWHYLVGTTDGATFRIYFDGDIKNTMTSTMSSAYYNVEIGSYAAGVSAFTGNIDDVRLYKSIISTSQIEEQYYAGLNRLLAKGEISKNGYSNEIR